MKQIKPSQNAEQWPRFSVEEVACRKQDLVIRISDWTKDKDEPGFDVEIYIGGVYDWNESGTFTIHELKTRDACKKAAVKFAQDQIAKLL